MRIRSYGTALAIASVSALGATLLVPASEAASGRACADAKYRLESGVIYAQTRDLRATRTTCTTARSVALTILRTAEGNAGPTARPKGFRCRAKSNGNGWTCTKGVRRVTWTY